MRKHLTGELVWARNKQQKLMYLLQHVLRDSPALWVGGVGVPVLGGAPPDKVCQLAAGVGSLEGSHVRQQQASPFQACLGRLACPALDCTNQSRLCL